jgi:hypothetical protein
VGRFPQLDVIPRDETRNLLVNARRLIAEKLTRKARAELGL